MLKSSVSGFPEFLPSERSVEQLVLRQIRQTFATFGFENIENRAIEPVPALLSKGETSKEVYVLSRLQDAYESADGTVNLLERLESSKQLGLHFDLTVPFARYVVEAAGQLNFPFRRTSVGKVWRGERPQAGRFREFTQADVDIVARAENGQDAMNALPLFHDVDVVKAVRDALNSLRTFGVPEAVIHVNNRKLLQGCYEAIGVHDFAKTLQTLDKIDKIGVEKVLELLTEAGESSDVAKQCVQMASISGSLELLQANSLLSDLVRKSELAREGFDELIYLVQEIGQQAIVDLKITRGLDYYTGSVFETFLQGHETYGSVASGGRYENLASALQGANTKVSFPGVGMSIGVTRLMAIGFSNNFFDAQIQKYQPARVLVAVNSEKTRHISNSVADSLRAENIGAYTCPNSSKFGKQIDFAFKRGIAYILFPVVNEQSSDINTSSYRLKNVQTGNEQEFAELEDVHEFICG